MASRQIEVELDGITTFAAVTEAHGFRPAAERLGVETGDKSEARCPALVTLPAIIDEQK